MDIKKCSKCQIEKDINEYEFIKKKKIHRGCCKECRNKDRKNQRIELINKIQSKQIEKPDVKTSFCHTCKKNMDVSNFSYIIGSNKYSIKCKLCHNNDARKKNEDNQKSFGQLHEHKCDDCNLIKNTDQFVIAIKPKIKYSKICVTCRGERISYAKKSKLKEDYEHNSKIINKNHEDLESDTHIKVIKAMKNIVNAIENNNKIIDKWSIIMETNKK